MCHGDRIGVVGKPLSLAHASTRRSRHYMYCMRRDGGGGGVRNRERRGGREGGREREREDAAVFLIVGNGEEKIASIY